jgi:hypothetical protein
LGGYEVGIRDGDELDFGTVLERLQIRLRNGPRADQTEADRTLGDVF